MVLPASWPKEKATRKFLIALTLTETESLHCSGLFLACPYSFLLNCCKITSPSLLIMFILSLCVSLEWAVGVLPPFYNLSLLPHNFFISAIPLMLQKGRLIDFFSSQSFCPHPSLLCIRKKISSLERPLFSQASGQLCCLPGVEQHHSNATSSSIRALGFVLEVKSVAKITADWTEYHLGVKKNTKEHKKIPYKYSDDFTWE